VRRFAVLAAVLLLAGGLTACGSESWVKKCTTSAAGVITCRPDQRPAAKDVTGQLLDGGTYDVAADRGKVVVVNFWGSWCGPCRAEATDLQKTYDATRERGVSFVGVNTRDDRDAAKAFARGRGVTYPSIYDPDGRVALAFDVTQMSTPSTLILDRQGRIAAAMRRATIASELQPLVERVTSEDPG